MLLTSLSFTGTSAQSITIDWTLNEHGSATPTVNVGSDDASDADLGENAADKSDNDNADAWEQTWWRDGFADDTQESWFAASRTPRGPRPESMVALAHSIGTVYRHTQTGAKGVIVGWDARTRAPRNWLGPNIPAQRSWSDRLRRLHAPHYSVLEQIEQADGQYRFMQRYIVAHCTDEGESGPPCIMVEPPASKLVHPDLDRYFSGHNADGYMPTAELRAIYPHG